jgi:hypothetical protein
MCIKIKLSLCHDSPVIPTYISNVINSICSNCGKPCQIYISDALNEKEIKKEIKTYKQEEKYCIKEEKYI